ncbi:transposase, MuDR, MULE transposase domain protein, partial [Tanacetum coccineum]
TENEGTVTRIKTNDQGVSEMLFIATGASIRTFVNYLRPLLIIDATHLKGQYKGINLVDADMIGNNQIVPIAFGICKSETGPCWSWWMYVLKECIGDNPNLLFISDRHPSIALAVQNEFPLAFHALVLKDGREHIAHLLTDAYRNVESVNACSVINRKLPVLMLAETYRAMLQEWYFKRKKLTENVKYEITDWATHKVHKRKLKSATWIVHGVNQYVYQVFDGLYNRQVNLETGVCECRKWQLSGIPCGHVIAVTRFLGLTDCVQYVSDWFKKDKYQATYAESIHFLGDMQEWEYPSHIHPAIPPRMDNPQPGRPKNTNRIRSQGEEPQSIHCSKCKQDCHKRDNCKISIVNEPHVNDQPAFYHQNQSYDHNFQSYNQYPSQPYGDVTYQGQPDYHNQYPTHPSQMNEQYDSQQYGTQHLDDLNNNCSNSWFN